jgi:hypothetical protein
LVSFRLPTRRSLQRVGRSAALAIVWNVVVMLYLTVEALVRDTWFVPES